MAKKKKKRGPRPEHKPAPAPAAAAQSPKPKAQSPSFWFSFSVPWAKLAAGRVVLFGLLAIDALLQIRHAPRYGAGGFNVGQLPIFDAHGPSRGSYEVCELINAYLFVLVACGVGT